MYQPLYVVPCLYSVLPEHCGVGTILTPIWHRENGNTERSSHLPKVTELVSVEQGCERRQSDFRVDIWNKSLPPWPCWWGKLKRPLDQAGSYPMRHFCFWRVYFYTLTAFFIRVFWEWTRAVSYWQEETDDSWWRRRSGAGGTLSSPRIPFFTLEEVAECITGEKWIWEVTWIIVPPLGRTPCCQKNDSKEFLLQQGDQVTCVEQRPGAYVLLSWPDVLFSWVSPGILMVLKSALEINPLEQAALVVSPLLTCC